MLRYFYLLLFLFQVALLPLAVIYGDATTVIAVCAGVVINGCIWAGSLLEY